MLVLITGGVRSGKSRLAEQMASRAGQKTCYVATMEPFDDEVRERIRTHRERRPAHWITVEEPINVSEAISERAGAFDAIVVDCLGLFVTNILMRQDESMAYSRRCEEVLDRVRELARVATASPALVIVVSNEVGLGIVPESMLGRLFRDALGWANQILAEASTSVYLTVAGIPLQIKKTEGN